MPRATAARFLGASLMTLAALTASGCGGDASFGSQGKHDSSADANGVQGQEPPPGDGDPAAPAPLAALTWFWQCDSDVVATPVAKNEKEKVIEGKGPFQFEPIQLQGTPITFSGHLCKPAELPRDIVFVIDTSDSMNQNDPRTGNTCGRLTALQAVVSSIPAGSSHFSIVTFNSALDKASTAMFDSQAALFADIAPGGNIADVLCHGTGGTNYQAALVEAGDILATGRPLATKEIYFVSDGQPNGGQTGVAEATALKGVGVNVGSDFITVTIATVMLAGTDQILEQQIASKDPSGKPLHAYVAQTSQLTKVLTDLAANGVAGGSLKYRPIGTTQYTTLSLLDHVQGFDFTLPSISINMDQAPNGLEVLLEYYDRHDNRYSSGGKLLWKVDDGAS